MNVSKFWSQALNITEREQFNELAMELFFYQSVHVETYKTYLQFLNFDVKKARSISDIPFLPVQLFKNHIITDQNSIPELFFTSSGTSGQLPGLHYVVDENIYLESLLNGFKLFYGDPDRYCFLALLPSYADRSGSSLIYMVKSLMAESKHGSNGFFLDDFDQLSAQLTVQSQSNSEVILIGVSFALLDYFESHPSNYPKLIILETGGMKGRRKELTRNELHRKLSELSGTGEIHSEYGMTELLSQAYSKELGRFAFPNWAKVIIRDLNDPFREVGPNETGLINVIDLANVHSCAFIATQDIGRLLHNNQFEVLGRMDNSELRGCNLMIA